MNKYNDHYDKSVFAVLPINEVASRLFVKDGDTARNWLKNNKVPVYKIANKCMVYEYDFEYALALPLARNFKKLHPSKWKELFQKLCKNDAILSMVCLSLGDDVPIRIPTTKVLPKNQKERELLNKLLK